MSGRIDAKLFDHLTHSAGLAADMAASNAYREGKTQAQIVSAGVEAAFAHAVGLRLIKVNPLSDWPQLRRLVWVREDVVSVSTEDEK